MNEKNKPLKFLIVRLSSLGDIIHSLPLVWKIKKEIPEATVDWLVGPKGTGILSMIKEINTVYELSARSLTEIRKQDYDYVLDVQGLFKSALLSKMSNGKKVIGFKGTREFADIFYDVKVDVGDLFKTKEHIVDLNLKLLSEVFKSSDKEISFLIPKVESENVSVESSALPKILLLPATTWKSKMWSLSYWKELILMLDKNYDLYLTASKSDLTFISELLNDLDKEKANYKNLVTKTNIKDLIYLMQNVDLVIGMDSGGIHLASAVKNDYKNLEVLGIYGPTSAYRNGIYSSNKANILLNSLFDNDLDCIACKKKVCPYEHNNCMNNITPEFIYKTIKERINKKTTSQIN